MKRETRFFAALIAAFFACVVSGAGYAQSPQPVNLTRPVSVVIVFEGKPAAGEITTGRARSLVGGVVGLISVVVGGLALARSGRSAAIGAVMLGLLGMILSIIHLATFTGGFGTGSGRAGAIIALVLSLIGISLGGLASARARSLQTRL